MGVEGLNLFPARSHLDRKRRDHGDPRSCREGVLDTRKRRLTEFLILSARTGEGDALNQLARLWHPGLLAYAARQLGDRDVARDALQEAWLDILRGLPRLSEPRAFPAWAYRILSRKCARQIGSAVRQRETADAVMIDPTEPDQAESDAETRAELQLIRRAITALPPGQRAAVTLHYLEQMSLTEIALALQIPVGTAKTRLMHGRKSLKAALNLIETGETDEHER